MKEKTIINIAKKFLDSKAIEYAEPGKLGRMDGNLHEVIFLDPFMLDPKGGIVDPEDVRVIVNIKTGKASLVIQM